jgi:hypothetical protein
MAKTEIAVVQRAARPDTELVSGEEILDDDRVNAAIAPAGDKYQELTEIEDPSRDSPEQRLLEGLGEILTRYRNSPSFQDALARGASRRGAPTTRAACRCSPRGTTSSASRRRCRRARFT